MLNRNFFGRWILLGAIGAFASTIVLAQDSVPETGDVTPEIEAIMDSCGKYKFETIAETIENGKPRRQRIRLCGFEAKTDADWSSTLNDAIEKVKASDTFSAEAKDQIVAAIGAEITKLGLGGMPEDSASPAASVPGPVAPGSDAAIAGSAPVQIPSPTAQPLAVPPPAVARPVAAVSAKPNLSIACATRGSIGESCDVLEGKSIVTVRANEDLLNPAGLRFLRRGSARAEIAVPRMEKGESRRFTLPSRLCAGVNSTSVEIQILDRSAGGGGAEVVETLGPFSLRC